MEHGGRSMTHLFCTEHMWDSLHDIPHAREHIEEVIERTQREYVAGLLPFLSFAHLEEVRECIPHFRDFCTDKNNLIIIGIGGSCVGIKALVQLLSPEQEFNSRKRIYFVENMDSTYMRLLQSTLQPEDTAILAISKSGNTIETVSQYMLLKEWVMHSVDTWNKHCAIITDDTEGFLFLEAQRYNLFLATIPRALGGRYSVLSAVGILPMVFLEKDYDALIKGAMESAQHIMQSLPRIATNPLWKIVLWQYIAEKQGMTQSILFSYIPRSMNLGLWFMQLWAESLGKEGKGTFPIFAQGVVDQHSLQQMFLDGKKQSTCIFLYVHGIKEDDLRIKNDNPMWEYIHGRTLSDILSAEYQGTVEAFIKEGIPHIEFGIAGLSEYSIAELFVFFQSLVFLLGRLLEINPLDQPAVEYGKSITKAILQDNALALHDDI